VSRLIDREVDHETIYPVDVPGYVFPKRVGKPEPARIFLSFDQLTKLRANVAKAILRANKHRMESK